MKKHFVYIILCKDNTLYTGYTTDILKRFDAHKEGKGAKYTRARKVLKIVYVEQLESKSLAMKREYEIKKLKRVDKELLIDLDFDVDKYMKSIEDTNNIKK